MNLDKLNIKNLDDEIIQHNSKVNEIIESIKDSIKNMNYDNTKSIQDTKSELLSSIKELETQWIIKSLDLDNNIKQKENFKVELDEKRELLFTILKEKTVLLDLLTKNKSKIDDLHKKNIELHSVISNYKSQIDKQDFFKGEVNRQINQNKELFAERNVYLSRIATLEASLGYRLARALSSPFSTIKSLFGGNKANAVQSQNQLETAQIDKPTPQNVNNDLQYPKLSSLLRKDKKGNPFSPVNSHSNTNQVVHTIENLIFESNDIVVCSGWVIALNGIDSIEVYSNERIIAKGACSFKREDVTKAFPKYDASGDTGFNIKIDIKKIEKNLSLIFYTKDKKYKIINVDIKDVLEQKNIKLLKQDTYKVWIENNRITSEIRKIISDNQKSFKYKPLISIVMPVYNVEKKWLKIAVESILSQTYENWQLCMVDDKSTKDHIVPTLVEFSKSDKRIQPVFRKENGNISATTNSGLEKANVDFIVFMDHDDALAPNALYEIVNNLNQDKTIDVLYSDEDKIDVSGNRFNPLFKPDWSPELILSYNYLNHLLCVRATLCKQIAFRSKYDGVQDYDFILRLIEKTDRIVHIPKVLYHWRALPESIAGEGGAKSDSFNFFTKCTKTLQEYLDRNNLKGKAYQPEFAINQNLGLNHIDWSPKEDLVSIIIPSKNHFETLKNCVDSITKKTTYKNYEILILDNDSDDAKTLKYLQKIQKQKNINVKTIKNKDALFSYSYINNEGTKYAKGDLFLFLNDDTEVINPNWLSQMVGYKSIKGVGIVGAKLIYPDDTVQHAGVINGLYPHGYDNLPDHVFNGIPKDNNGYAFFANASRNYSSVTAACMLIDKKLFNEVGKFDEINFGLAYNDIDLCLKVIQKNQRVVFAVNANLYHHESKSRKQTLNIKEVSSFKNKYRDFKDPYYNPNFSKTNYFRVEPLNHSKYKLSTDAYLFVSHNLNLEGAPLQMLEIIEGLIKFKKLKASQITVCSPKEGPLLEAYKELGINVKIVEDLIKLTYETDISYDDHLKSLVVWMNKGNYKKVFINTLVPFYYVEACKQLKVPAIWAIHESVSPIKFYNYLQPKLKKRAIEVFNDYYVLIFVAKATARIFAKYNVKSSMAVINNALKLDRFNNLNNIQDARKKSRKSLGITETDVVFLNLGTICSRKGQLDFTKSAVKSLKQNKNAKFLMVGARDEGETGKYLAQINTIIKENKCEDRFIIINETKEVEKYYAASDIFVCSSYNESYPRVILEAMIFSLPIITTPIFGIVEQVIENSNALFYNPGDVKKLEQHLSSLSKDTKLRTFFGNNSRHTFDLINTYEEMIDKYDFLLG